MRNNQRKQTKTVAVTRPARVRARLPLRSRVVRRTIARRGRVLANTTIRRRTARQVNAQLGQPTIIGKALRAVGTIGGSYFGNPTAGANLGAGISRIFGQGDYVIKQNSLMNAGPPAFAAINTGIRMAHREYVTDILSSIQFNNTTYQVTPTNPLLFPWMSNIATNFEEYKIHGLIFYFNTTSGDAVSSTNNALGTVGMTTVYDPSDPDLSSKREAEDYAGCVAGVPSNSSIHPVECKQGANVLSRLYVQTVPVVNNEDLKFYSMGKLNVFTQGMQQAGVTIGELWVSYDIEFFNPKILPVGTTQLAAGKLYTPSVPTTSTSKFGSALQIATYGNIPFTVQNNAITIPKGSASGSYIFLWYGNSAVAWSGGSSIDTTTSNIQTQNVMINGASYSYPVPEFTPATQRHEVAFAFNKLDTNQATINLNVSTVGTDFSYDAWLFKVPASTFTGVQSQVPGLFDTLVQKLVRPHNPIDGSAFDQQQNPQLQSLLSQALTSSQLEEQQIKYREMVQRHKDLNDKSAVTDLKTQLLRAFKDPEFCDYIGLELAHSASDSDETPDSEEEI